MPDYRSKRERQIDNAVDRDQARRWQQDEFIIRPLKVTQVGRDGFFYLEDGRVIPTFHPWPRSGEATEGSKFGRVVRKDG